MNGISTSMIIAICVIMLLVILAIIIIVKYRKLNTMRTRTEETFMFMETYMKQRHQMINRFVSYLKRVSNVQEQAIIDDVINARNVATQTKSRDQKVAAESDLQRKLNRLYDFIRNSSEIEKDTDFDDMLAEMRTMESKVARTRISYNENVEAQNNAMHSFFGRMVSVMFGFDYEEEFIIDDTALPSDYHL